MKHFRIKLSLFINYFIFAILLNSVGTVILLVQTSYGMPESSAGVLEGFKDLSIAVTSFLVAPYIVRIGYKRAMLVGLACVGLMCLAMPQLPAFWMTKVLFAVVGMNFALIKISVFATIGLITADKKEHISFMNFIESFFMVGILSGYFLFSLFVGDHNPDPASWLNVYYLLGGLSFAAFLLLLSASLDETGVRAQADANPGREFTGMLGLVVKPLVLLFVISAFLYVLIEQGIMSWLPTFNSKVLNLSDGLSIQMASILAGSFAAGRFLGGVILKKFDWFAVLSVCLLAAAGLVVASMRLAGGVEPGLVSSWLDAPPAAFIFPLIGICLAPVYPAINSVILNTLPIRQHAPMAGLIVVFSAIGGTTGALITGYLFEIFDGQTAYTLSLLPLAIILLVLYFFRQETGKAIR